MKENLMVFELFLIPAYLAITSINLKIYRLSSVHVLIPLLGLTCYYVRPHHYFTCCMVVSKSMNEEKKIEGRNPVVICSAKKGVQKQIWKFLFFILYIFYIFKMIYYFKLISIFCSINRNIIRHL